MTTLTTEQQERVKALATKSGIHYNEIGVDLFRFSTGQLHHFVATLLSELSAQKVQEPYAGQQWKSGNEYLPYHPSASHVSPAYRDGWNACYKAATPSLRVNPVAVTHLMITPEQGYRIYVDDAAEAERFRSMHGRSVQPLGVIMEADKVDELIELRAENAAYEEVATLMDTKSRMVNPAWVAEIVRALKSANAVRIAEIEGKTE